MELDTNNMYTQQNPNWVIMTNTLTVVLKNSMDIIWCILLYSCLHYSVNNNSICIVAVTLHPYLNRSACFCKLLGPVANDNSTVSENVGQCSSFSRLFSLWATFNCNKNTCRYYRYLYTHPYRSYNYFIEIPSWRNEKTIFRVQNICKNINCSRIINIKYPSQTSYRNCIELNDMKTSLNYTIKKRDYN